MATGVLGQGVFETYLQKCKQICLEIFAIYLEERKQICFQVLDRKCIQKIKVLLIILR